MTVHKKLEIKLLKFLLWLISHFVIHAWLKMIGKDLGTKRLLNKIVKIFTITNFMFYKYIF